MSGWELVTENKNSKEEDGGRATSIRLNTPRFYGRKYLIIFTNNIK